MDSKSQAEEKKKQGNEEHKKGNYALAARLYQEAIDLNPSEGLYYTNKAFSLIQLKEFLQAMHCCEQALRVNPGLGRAYKRMFRCYLSVGEFELAKGEL